MIPEEKYLYYIAKLESTEHIKIMQPDIEDVINDTSHRLMFESMIFNTLKSIYSTVTSPKWKTIRTEYIKYISLRVNQTNNLLLKSRYVSIKAICFRKDIDEAFHINCAFFSKIMTLPLHIGTYNETFYALIQSYTLLKKSPDYSVYQLFESILSNKDISSDNKRFLVSSIATCNVSRFSISHIKNLYTICESLLQETQERIRRKGLLANMITICERLKNSDPVYSDKEKILYEQMADNERSFILEKDPNNAMIPHLNHNILQNVVKWYKESGNTAKFNEAVQDLIKTKNSLIFPTYTFDIYSDEQKVLLCRYMEIIEQYNTPIYLNGLANNFFGIFPSHSIITDKTLKNTPIEGFEYVKVDACGNQTIVKDEDLPNFHYFTAFKEFLQPCLVNFSKQFLDKIAAGSLNYQTTKKALIKESIFGKSFVSMTGIQLKFFDFIELPMKNLFTEFTKIVNHRKYNLSVPLELLSLKLERLFREILYINGISTLATSNSADKEQFIMLDKILQRLEENKLFEIDDINFFRYVLTTDGYNLRNDTAHGLIDFRYYKTILGVHSCFLLFVCILKIAYKYQLYTKLS